MSKKKIKNPDRMSINIGMARRSRIIKAKASKKYPSEHAVVLAAIDALLPPPDEK